MRTTLRSIFTTSPGNQIILLIYGIVFPGGTKTIISHLCKEANLGVTLSTIIKSFSSKVGDILAHTTV